MKKIMTIVVALLCLVCAFALVACGGTKTAVAIALEGAEKESFAFCVKEGNTELKNSLDGFFSLTSTKTAIDTSINYHTGASETAIEYPNLSDNTGGELVMVTEAGFAPYEYAKQTGAGSVGGVAGVDVDIMMLFAESQNKTLKVKNVEFLSITAEVNKADNTVGAAGMTVNAEREEEVDFATPYVTSIQYVVSLEKNAYKALEDLKGKKVGVQTATTGDLYVMGDALAEGGVLYNTKAELKQYDKVMVAYQDLLAGKIDALIIDEFVAKGLVKNA